MMYVGEREFSEICLRHLSPTMLNSLLFDKQEVPRSEYTLKIVINNFCIVTLKNVTRII